MCHEEMKANEMKLHITWCKESIHKQKKTISHLSKSILHCLFGKRSFTEVYT